MCSEKYFFLLRWRCDGTSRNSDWTHVLLSHVQGLFYHDDVDKLIISCKQYKHSKNPKPRIRIKIRIISNLYP